MRILKYLTKVKSYFSFYVTVLIIGILILLTMQYTNLVADTLISNKWVYGAHFCFSFLLLPFTIQIFRRFGLVSLECFWLNLIFLVSLLELIFYSTNYLFCSREHKRLNVNIIEYRLSGTYKHSNRSTYAVINILNTEYEIHFEKGYVVDRDKKKLELSVSEGLFGLDVIKEKKQF